MKPPKITGSTSHEYFEGNVTGSGNGYFNRVYAVATKHLRTAWGEVELHVEYQRNWRTDYPINGPCSGMEWKPKWLENLVPLTGVGLVMEYDSRTVNAVAVVWLWNGRIEAKAELQNLRWLNCGLRLRMRE